MGGRLARQTNLWPAVSQAMPDSESLKGKHTGVYGWVREVRQKDQF